MSNKAVFVALAVALAIVGGVAYAAIPDGNIIHGCYHNVNGDLRVVEVADDCPGREIAIAWNQQGPQGEPGPQGISGNDGAAGISTATFAGTGSEVRLGSVFTRVVSKSLPAGSWAVTATVNLLATNASGDDETRGVACQLRNGDAVIGGTTDRRMIEGGPPPAEPNPEGTASPVPHTPEHVEISLSMNGGAQIPAGGGEVSLWCRAPQIGSFNVVEQAQMMLLQVGGFS